MHEAPAGQSEGAWQTGAQCPPVLELSVAQTALPGGPHSASLTHGVHRGLVDPPVLPLDDEPPVPPEVVAGPPELGVELLHAARHIRPMRPEVIADREFILSFPWRPADYPLGEH